MKLIRPDNPARCGECGTTKDLVVCTTKDSPNHPSSVNAVMEIFCNNCLNKFEEDEENYTVMS